MLDEDAIPTEEQLNDKEWLIKEMEEHSISLKVHKLRLCSYTLHLEKIAGREFARNLYKELLQW